VEHKFPALLPPLNVLTAAPPASGGLVEEWRIVEVGNGAGDLAFSGSRSAESSIVRAFVCPSREEASTTSLLYRGRRPSEAAFVVGPGRILSARALFDDTSTWWAPRRIAVLACRAAGWDFSGEWGGLGAAAMLRGTEEFVAPLWPIIDAPQAKIVDESVRGALGSSELWRSLWSSARQRSEELRTRPTTAIAPHWWAALAYMPR
jgi:hypothetical protein